MNNEDFVSYEIAQALKKAGFDLTCDRYWYQKFANSDNMALGQASTDDFNNDGWDVPHCSAPTLAQAQKWLREIIGIYVGANPAIQIRKWQFYLDDLNQHINPHDGELLTRCTEDMQDEYDKEYFDSYESALSAGIAAALKLIEEGEV